MQGMRYLSDHEAAVIVPKTMHTLRLCGGPSSIPENVLASMQYRTSLLFLRARSTLVEGDTIHPARIEFFVIDQDRRDQPRRISSSQMQPLWEELTRRHTRCHCFRRRAIAVDGTLRSQYARPWAFQTHAAWRARGFPLSTRRSRWNLAAGHRITMHSKSDRYETRGYGSHSVLMAP
ncbi:hypothetical protein FKP32DRAFT_877010 [Trametes sanguinea]|nr:hypothetical protein FKP32DRAFT_877010 [Trametes sanguinea]